MNFIITNEEIVYIRTEFGFSVEFFCIVPLLYIHNILIIINFDVLKYIKKIFKISTQYIFNAKQKIIPKKSVENLNSNEHVDYRL